MFANDNKIETIKRALRIIRTSRKYTNKIIDTNFTITFMAFIQSYSTLLRFKWIRFEGSRVYFYMFIDMDEPFTMAYDTKEDRIDFI